MNDGKLKELEPRQSDADLSPYMTTFENGYSLQLDTNECVSRLPIPKRIRNESSPCTNWS